MIWLAISYSAVLVACATVPEKPKVTLYTINARDQYLIGASSDSPVIVPNLPLVNADKYLCFSPQDFKEISVYLQVLRARVERNCQ